MTMRPQSNEDEPPGSCIRNRYVQVQQTEQKRKLSSVFYFVDLRVKFGNFTS